MLELSKTEQLILNIISLEGNITRNNICKQTNLSLRTVARALNSLKSERVIYRFGSDKNGQWKIAVNGKLLNIKKTIIKRINKMYVI